MAARDSSEQHCKPLRVQQKRTGKGPACTGASLQKATWIRDVSPGTSQTSLFWTLSCHPANIPPVAVFWMAADASSRVPLPSSPSPTPTLTNSHILVKGCLGDLGQISSLASLDRLGLALLTEEV